MGATATPEKDTSKNQLLEPSALQKGVAAAKEALAKGEAPATLEEPVIGEPGTKVQPPAKQPDPAQPEDEAPAEEGEEGEAQPEGEAAAAGAEGETTDEVEPLVVTLPELRKGQGPIELEVEEQEAADAINALVKGNMRREEFNRGMEDYQQRKEEITQLEDMLTIDPVNFLVDRVRPELQARVAVHLLSLPGVYEAVAKAYTAEDGSEMDREKVGLKLQNERLSTRGTSNDEMQARAEARTAGRDLANAVERMIPENFSDDDAASLRDDLLRDLRDYVETERIERLRPDQLPDILERRLRQYQVTVEDAATALSANAPATIRPRSPSRPAAGGPPEGAPARTTGQKLREGAEARRRAAAVPGAGAGAPPTRTTLPAGQSIQDRVKSLREQFGISKR